MTPATVILIPVLGRPEKVKPLLENIEAMTPEPHRVLFLTSPDDELEKAAIRDAGGEYHSHEDCHTWPEKINEGYQCTTEPWLFLGADDLKFHRYWLDIALEVAEESGAGVIGTNDLCNDRSMRGLHSTHSLVRRAYIDEQSGVMDEPGVVLHAGYAHDYADDELVETARARGKFAHAILSGVEHMHPLCNKAPMDATYELGMRVGPGPGRTLFRKRRALWDPNVTARASRFLGSPSRRGRG